MFLLTIGGDMRYACLTAMAAAQSMEIAAVGLERCPVSLPAASISDVCRADALILPNPWRNGLSIPYAEQPFAFADVLSQARPDVPILLSDAVAMPPLPDANRYIDLSADPEYVLKNAHLTAEAALCRAMQLSSRALMDSMCLVIGYGRIGRRLARLLHAMGADTAAAARRKAVRAEIAADGISAFSMEDLKALLPRADFIFSTPPDTVLDDALLPLVRPDALLMDLASPPYGFDLALAKSLSLNAVRENGLPGRCCPHSAGAAMLEAVRRALDHYSKGGSACS